jgi:hypothetical protein
VSARIISSSKSGRLTDLQQNATFSSRIRVAQNAFASENLTQTDRDRRADAETIWLNRDLWKSQEPPSKGGAVEAGDVR